MLTVITVTYNAEASIRDTLESIVLCPFVNRIIIKDGISTDNTIRIINSFSDPRIEVHSVIDSGIYDAMNFAMQLVMVDDYFCFINSGDFLNVKAFSRCTELKYPLIFFPVMIQNSKDQIWKFDVNFSKVVPRIHHQGIIVKMQTKRLLFDLEVGLMADLDWMLNLLHDNNQKFIVSKHFLSTISTGGVSDVKSLARFLSYIKFCKKHKISFVKTFDFYKILLKIFLPYFLIDAFRLYHRRKY